MVRGEGAEDDIDEHTWETWNRVLAPHSVKKPGKAGRSGSDEALDAVYALAVELRDRLRYSEQRVVQLKGELRQERAHGVEERQAQAGRLAGFERDVGRLAASVQAQALQISSQEALAANLQAENALLRQQLAAQDAICNNLTAENTKLRPQLAVAQEAARQLPEVTERLSSQEALCRELRREAAGLRDEVAAGAREAEAHRMRAEVAEQERSKLLGELSDMRSELDEVYHRLNAREDKENEMREALLASKSRLSELSRLEGLYRAARDELDRLDKENGELKEMVAQGALSLTRSRILDGTPTEHLFKSTPLFMSPQQTGRRKAGSRSRSRGRSTSPYRDAMLAATGVIYPDDNGGVTYTNPRSRSASPGRGPRSPAPSGADPRGALELPGMAFLGPPSSAYPQDPDKFVYVRVAGGYSPMYVGKEERPSVSGWVPKEVVRLVQAFRHSYGLELEWRFWEPLLLMVDEVYRRQQVLSMEGLKAATTGKVQTLKRQLQGSGAYPSVVQAGRIAHLRRQLASARRGLAAVEQRKDGVLRHLAEKEYHLAHQLDDVVDENLSLRKSMAQLDELYDREAGLRAAAAGATTRLAQRG